MSPRIEGSDLTLQVLTRPEEWDDLVPQWQALIQRLPSPTLNQLPIYYEAFVDAFKPTLRDLFAVAISRGDALAALLPLRLVERRIHGWNLRILEFPELPMPVRDLVIAPELSVCSVVECLERNFASVSGMEWDYLHLRNLLSTSAILGKNAIPAGAPAIRTGLGYSHALDVSGADYIDKILNSKARNNLRRNRRRLAQLGHYEFATVDTLPELHAAYDHFLDAEAAGWKSVHGGRRAVKLHLDQTAFYRALMIRAARQKQCQIHLLFLEGKAIAADYCILTRDVCYSLKHGYDEQFSNVAPGNLLREFAINYYCGRPDINTVDLISDQPWHLSWRPLRREVFDIRIFRRTLRARVLYYLLKLRRGTSSNN